MRGLTPSKHGVNGKAVRAEKDEMNAIVVVVVVVIIIINHIVE